MTKNGNGAFLGIDLGTQGLTSLLVDENLDVLATGEASYECIPGPPGHYEQKPSDWERALQLALEAIEPISSVRTILGIGISGQMHGHCLVNKENQLACDTARLWCDARNEEEAQELSNLFQSKIPKRSTIARWLWTIRNQDSNLVENVDYLTTPAGWLHLKLTGRRVLGIGEASGMFPIHALNYDQDMIVKFNKLTQQEQKIKPVHQLLPQVVLVGQDAGTVTDEAAKRFPGLKPGIPVSAPEGDQPAALAGSLIGRPGLISCSFGTSVCANVVGFSNEDKSTTVRTNSQSSVDIFCAPNGQTIYMVWLRNGTTFFNTIVSNYSDGTQKASFERIMPLVLKAPPDCEGLIALPFMDDEPGLKISEGGTALIMGWNAYNSKCPGNACKAALTATMYNLKLGLEDLLLQRPEQPLTEIVLSGGIVLTPETGQILSNIMDLPVRLLTAAEEGCSWGAAVLAKYRYLCCTGGCTEDWPTYLESITLPSDSTLFLPKRSEVMLYGEHYKKYKRLLALQSQLQHALDPNLQ